MKEWLAFVKEMVAGQLRANQLKLFVTTDYSDMRASTSSLAALFGRGKTPFALVGEGPGNNACADCGRKAPDWASISLGVLICYECSAVHRNLGARTFLSSRHPLSVPHCLHTTAEPPVKSLAQFIDALTHAPPQTSRRCAR